MTAGRPLTIDRLFGCAHPLGYWVTLSAKARSVLGASRLPRSRRSVCRYIHGIITQWPQSLPLLQEIVVSGVTPQRRFSVVRTHPQLVAAVGSRNVIHTDGRIVDWGLAGLD